MKKITFLFYLNFVPVFVLAQSVAGSGCRANIEKIFKAADLKYKYETALHFEEFSESKNSKRTVKFTEDQYAHDFKEITGVPLDSGKYKGAISVEINAEDFAKKLNYSSSQALQEYTDLIKNIKVDKEVCLKCIDAEIAKGESSEYKDKVMRYDYYPRKWASIQILPYLAKLDYLRLFKEFIFNNNEDILPSTYEVIAYIHYGCNVHGYGSEQNNSSLSILPVSVLAQSVADSVCRARIEKIFKAADLRIKCEAVSYFKEFSESKNSEITVSFEEDQYARYFEEITGVPLDSGKYKGAISVKIDAGNFAEKLNYSSRQAWEEYTDFIKTIQSDREICMKCIDAELARGDSSEYANGAVIPYDYHNPQSRWLLIAGTPLFLTKSDYLKVFKEFIFNHNEKALPHPVKAVVYLKCGRKMPYCP